MPSMRKIFISLQHLSASCIRWEPGTTKGYMMLNLLVKNKDVWSKVEWYTRVGRTSIV